MKPKRFSLVFGLLFIYLTSYSQSIDIIKAKFESFEYNTAIELINNKFLSDTSLTKDQKIDLLKMKAISFYSLSVPDSARKSFIDLLYLDENVDFDPVRTSPKIIEYFNSVKLVFENIVENKATEDTQEPGDVKEQIEHQIFDSDLYTKSIFRSILLPGLGHLTAGSKTKGWLLTTFGTANLAAMVYYIFDTNTKEKQYLNEKDLAKIGSKYNTYNESYKIRNILIGTFTAIWFYSQIDLLFNEDDLFIKKVKPSLSLKTNQFGSYYSLSVTVAF